MKLLNWNVNGLRARWNQLIGILEIHNPDIVTLQESKISLSDFEDYKYLLLDKGYTSFLSPSNTGFHGVLTLIKIGIDSYSHIEIQPGRVTSVFINGIYFYNVYINQGQSVKSSEYAEKELLLYILSNRLSLHKHYEEQVVVSGDFNICPTGLEVWSVDHWNDETITCTPLERNWFFNLLNKSGLTNIAVSNQVKFTWYGYRHQWRKYKDDVLVDVSGKYGIKCDHILSNLGNSNTIELLIQERFPLIKSTEATSDHVPMILEVL